MSHLGYLRGRPTPPSGTPGVLARLRGALRPLALSELALRGARPAAPVRLVIARDVSGSMTQFAAAREAALDELVAWAPSNLRATDQLGVLDFAEDARWALRPTSVADLAVHGARRRPTNLDGGGTAWRPVLDRVQALGDHPGRVSLWLVSDGEYPDYPESADAAQRRLLDAGVQSMPLLVPSQSAVIPDAWLDVFPGQPSVSFEGLDGPATAVAFAHALAAVTGQRLVRVAARPGTEEVA